MLNEKNNYQQVIKVHEKIIENFSTEVGFNSHPTESEISIALKSYINPIERNKMRQVFMRKILKFIIHSKLGSRCNLCGITDERVLQIDHINNDGAIHRKEYIKNFTRNKRAPSNLDYYRNIIDSINKNEDRFQLLCANCNWLKRYTND